MRKPYGPMSSIAASLLLAALLVPTLSWGGEATIEDLFLQRKEDRTRLLFKGEGSFHFSASPWGRNGILLSFPDARVGPEARLRVDQLKELRVEPGSGGMKTRFRVSLPGTVRELRAQWEAKSRLLAVEAYGAPRAKAYGAAEGGTVSLAAIRFGPEPDSTRLVMAFSGKPSWDLEQVHGGEVLVRIRGAVWAKKKTRTGPVGLLSETILTQIKQNHALFLVVRGKWARHRIFWLSEGNRLVLDFYKQPDPAMVAMSVPGDFGRVSLVSGEDSAAQKHPQPPRHSLPDTGDGVSSVLSPARAEASGIPPGRQMSPPRKGPYERHPIPSLKTLARKSAPGQRPKPDDGKGVGGKAHPNALAVTKASSQASFSPRFQGVSQGEMALYAEIMKARDLGEANRGAALIDRFVKRFPSSPLMEKLLFLKGDLYYGALASGRKDLLGRVVSSYQEAATRFKQSPRVPDAYIRMARANRLAGNIYPALGYVNVVIDRFPKGSYTPFALLERGRIHMMRRSLDRASEDFMEIIRNYPNSSAAKEAALGIARYFHEKGMYAEAEKRLSALESEDARFGITHPEYFELRARTLSDLKRYAEARKYYYKALNLAPAEGRSPMLLAHIGDTYLQQGRKEEARKLFEYTVKEFPGSEGADVAKLRLAELSSKVEGFQRLYKENAGKTIGQIAILKVADAYYRQGQYDKAMQSLMVLVTSPVGSQIRTAAMALFCKAVGRQIGEHFEREGYQAVVELFQKHADLLRGQAPPDVRMKVALSLDRLGRHQEAVKLFGSFDPLDLAPGDRGSYFLGLARAHIALGDRKQAAAVLERNLSRAPKGEQRVSMTLLLADTYRDTKMPEKALALYGRLARDKGFLSSLQKAHVYYNAGKILNDQGRFEEARGFLNRAVAIWEKESEKSERLPSALEALAVGYQKQKNYPMAASVLEEALAGGVKSGTSGYWLLKYRLSQVYLSMGRVDGAETLLVELSEEGPAELQARVQMNLGAIRLKKALGKLSGWKAEREG